ncbi:MAG TPA: DUF3343 domain-containing protein [Spirochaetota bacterium]|nr:DUF3343 domain-containing protein [Spirochaetota bacterium]HOD14353.1 DUF3343 domain-containing protein [Spirochaetota bacterium]HPG51235.1 DUF3343 domain-containing protein [Spirochaetota bacterium]HPN12421.1 DUF3343 domain-containing protein [Spirochaetota bacterium]
MNRFSAILFRSSGYSLWAALHLKTAGIERHLIPVPRSVSAECGYCIRILTGDAQRAHKVLANAGVEFINIVELEERAFA